MPPRERPLVSRVLEIGMHGLIGGLTEMLAPHCETILLAYTSPASFVANLSMLFTAPFTAR